MEKSSFILYLYSLLFLGLLLCSGEAQKILNDHKRIITGGDPIIAMDVIGANAACSQFLVYLTQSTPNVCVVVVNSEGAQVSSDCSNADLNTATDMACAGPTHCHITVAGKVIVINPHFGGAAPVITYGEGNVTNPKTIQVTYSTNEAMGWSFIDILVVDSDGSLWVFGNSADRFFLDPLVGSLVYTFTTVPTVLTRHISAPDKAHDILALVPHATAINSYTLYGLTWNATGKYPVNFADVGALNVDFYGRVFVYDIAVPTMVNMFTSMDGELLANITVENAPLAIKSSRNHIYIRDAQGIVRYEDIKLDVLFRFTNKHCDSTLGSIGITSEGGSFPLTYTLYPGAKPITDRSYAPQYVNSFPELDVLIPLYTATIFNETHSNSIAPEINTFATYERVNSSVINVTYGDYAMEVHFLADPDFIEAGRVELKCFYSRVPCFNTRMDLVEFYFNPGLGGQSIEVYFADDSGGDVLQRYYIYPDIFPNNTWTKISIELTFSKPWMTMGFVDSLIGAELNPFYIDLLVVYPSPDHFYHVVVQDYCHTQNITSMEYDVTNDESMTVTIATQPTTCNAANQINGDKTHNGVANATVTHGEGPYTYLWTFLNANESSSVVTNITALSNTIIVYDNDLNATGWYDASVLIGGNPHDTTYFHSAPYSYSMPMPVNGDSLSLQFNFRGIISATATSSISFWVHGGETGGQSVGLRLMRYSAEIIVEQDIIDLLGIATIPPNTWLKVTRKLKNPFNSIQVFANGNVEQSTIYLDDFEINLAPALTVLDTDFCQSSVQEIVVTAPPPLVLTPTFSNALCFNSSDGSMELLVEGGAAPYTYKWQVSGVNVGGNSASNRLDGLAESPVSVDITDANGCSANTVVQQILQPPALELSFKAEPITCYGGSATITSYMYGGNVPYTYAWNSDAKLELVPQPAPSPVFTDEFSFSNVNSSNAKVVCLGSGAKLSYVPTHSGYCSILASFNASASQAVLSGVSILLDKFDTLGFWLYLENAQDAQNLQVSVARAGVAVIAPRPIRDLITGTITSGSWNQVTFNFSAASNTNPNQIVLTSLTPAAMGRVLIDDIVLIPRVSSSVGISVYSGFKSVVTGPAGLYFLTVVDGNGCSFLNTINVTQPEALEVVATVVGASKSSRADGSVKLSATGGRPPYSFLWMSTNTTGTTVNDIMFGIYDVQVTDANGCTHISSVVVPLDERLTLRSFNKGLSAGLSVVAAVGIALALFAIFMMARYRSTQSKLGGMFNGIILLGVLLGCLSVVVLLPKPTDSLCLAFPWILGIAFTLVYSCLFIKTFTLWRVWMNALNYKKTEVSVTKMVRTLVMALMIEFALLAVWTAIDPPTVHQVKVVNDTLEEQCDTKHPTFWILFITFKGVWLIFGAVMAILTRNVLKEFNESANIAYAIYNILVLVVIAVPLGSLLGSVPGGRLVIEIVVPVLAFTSTLVIMFFRTWHTVLFGVAEVKIPGMRTGGTPTGSGAGTTATSGSRGADSRGTDSRDVSASSKRNEETSSSVYPL